MEVLTICLQPRISVTVAYSGFDSASGGWLFKHFISITQEAQETFKCTFLKAHMLAYVVQRGNQKT